MGSPEDAMPWVGLYTAVASLICTLAMAADTVQGFWKWKLWFPNKYFTLNATTLTLMAIAMKLPVDLTTDMSSTGNAKVSSVFFLVTMVGNFLPSLGLMDDKELLMNIVALGILVFTVLVNILIQTFTRVISVPFMFLLTFVFIWPFSIALTVSTTRKKLEQQYKESQQLVSSHPEKTFSSKELKCYVKKYWMMVETRDPQFIIACSPVSCAFGVICIILASTLGYVVRTIHNIEDNPFDTSEYKWSVKIIFVIQSVGAVIGSLAPICRCFTSVGHYNLSEKWRKNQLNVFLVEKYWIQRLQQWKRSHVYSHIPSRHGKIVFHNLKNSFFNFCIALQIAVLVICKTICLVPRTFQILLSCCWNFFKSYLKRIKIVAAESLEIEEYSKYVVQVEEEAKLSKRILRNMLHSITQLIHESEKKEPRHLTILLEKSTEFNSVVEFDNDQVSPLSPKQTHNCWSLVVVTLTSVVIALSSNVNDNLKGLLSGIEEGLQYVRHIEEILYVDNDSLKARKVARCAWTDLELHRMWLQINLQKKTRKGKTSKEILNWLGDEAEKNLIQFKGSKKPSVDHSSYKYIIASSMCRITNSILTQCNEQEIWPNDEELLELISTIIANVLSACFTNLPRAIKMKCHHHAIEKRGDNIRSAARLIGKSKKILKILKARQHPNLDQDPMAYIDKWCVVTNTQISKGGIAKGSSSSNASLIVTVM